MFDFLIFLTDLAILLIFIGWINFYTYQNLTIFEKYELENCKAFPIIHLLIDIFSYFGVMFFFISLVSEFATYKNIYAGVPPMEWVILCGQFVFMVYLLTIFISQFTFNPLAEYEKETQESF
ncbi:MULTISPECIES: hypothetical protein [unclassified Companilactobacillus]|jgi:hypothetical protein|uniref:hypothetical protein n=1 Tax=unclassified Companilactobacillus TaxID=2767904 RepID=UPI002FEED8E7